MSRTSTLILLMALIFISRPLCAQPTYNREGKLDASFGASGIASVRSDISVEFGDAVALPSGGTLHGYSYYNQSVKVVFVVKQHIDGTFDTSFGTQGTAEIDIAEAGTNGVYVSSLAIQSDGGILVAGIAYKVTDVDGFVLRLSPSGALDTSFGNQGIVRFNFAPNADIRSDDWVSKVLVDKLGRIVVLTLSDQFPQSGTGTGYCILTRLLQNGSLDGTFGSKGTSTQPIGVRQPFYILVEMTDAQIQQDGKILVGATTQRESTTSPGVFSLHALVLRFLDNGSLDTGFANNGFFDVSTWTIFRALYLLPNGQILILCIGGLARLDPNGLLDTTFGNLGRVSQPDMGGNAIVVAGDQKIIVSGIKYLPGSNKAVSRLRRYWPDGTPDIRFGQGGQATVEMSGDFLMRLITIREDKYLIAACKISNQSFPCSARLFATRKG